MALTLCNLFIPTIKLSIHLSPSVALSNCDKMMQCTLHRDPVICQHPHSQGTHNSTLKSLTSANDRMVGTETALDYHSINENERLKHCILYPERILRLLRIKEAHCFICNRRSGIRFNLLFVYSVTGFSSKKDNAIEALSVISACHRGGRGEVLRREKTTPI